MKKNLIIVGIIILICSALVVSAYFYVAHSPTTKAKLQYGNGTVLVNGLSVNSNIQLKETDIIETKDGFAVVVIHESVFIQLKNDTKILLSDLNTEHPKIEQISGETWDNFVHSTTVKQFSVLQGAHTYTVNGTFFSINQARALAAQGVVYVVHGIKVIGVMKNQVLFFDFLDREKFTIRNFTQTEKAEIKESMMNAIEALKQQRQDEIDKHPEVISTVKSLTKMTEAELQSQLNSLDEGLESDVDSLVSQFPVPSKSVNKGAEFTKEIQRLHRYIKENLD